MAACGTCHLGIGQLRYNEGMASKRDDSDSTPENPRGPRGGKTTVSADGLLVRKTFFLDREVEEALREDSFRSRRTEAEIVRQLLRDHYGIE